MRAALRLNDRIKLRCQGAKNDRAGRGTVTHITIPPPFCTCLQRFVIAPAVHRNARPTNLVHVSEDQSMDSKMLSQKYGVQAIQFVV